MYVDTDMASRIKSELEICKASMMKQQRNKEVEAEGEEVIVVLGETWGQLGRHWPFLTLANGQFPYRNG